MKFLFVLEALRAISSIREKSDLIEDFYNFLLALFLSRNIQYGALYIFLLLKRNHDLFRANVETLRRQGYR